MNKSELIILKQLKDIDELKEYNMKLKDKAEQLQDRIDKAIEYINENWGHWCSNHCKYATETINILKGDNK